MNKRHPSLGLDFTAEMRFIKSKFFCNAFSRDILCEMLVNIRQHLFKMRIYGNLVTVIINIISAQ